MNRKQIKEKANSILSENFWNVCKSHLITLGISFILSFLIGLIFNDKLSWQYNSLYSIVTLVIIPLSIGQMKYLLNIIRKKDFSINDIFSKYNIILTIILTTILISVFTTLWTFLFIIPGVIAALSYSQAHYILADEKISAINAIKKSKTMMNGYKSDLFIFELSFLGWYILSGFTFGIALIYVLPYYSTAKAVYYDELKKLKKIK